MKKVLLTILLLVGLIILAIKLVGSNSDTKTIKLPNENIQIKDGRIFFKDKEYTGTLKLSKKIGYKGFVNIKNGDIDGDSEIQNDQKSIYAKFKIVNNIFEGEIIAKNKDQNLDMIVNFDNGKIVKLLGKLSDETQYDLVFIDGLANGWFENAGERFTFIDGITSVSENGITSNIKYYVNQETGNMGMEMSIDGKVLSKEEVPNKVFNVNYFKLLATSSIIESNVVSKKK